MTGPNTSDRIILREAWRLLCDVFELPHRGYPNAASYRRAIMDGLAGLPAQQAAAYLANLDQPVRDVVAGTPQPRTPAWTAEHESRP